MVRRGSGLASFVVVAALIAGAGCASSSDDETRATEPAVEALVYAPMVDADGREVLPNWATEEESATARTAPARAEPGDDDAPPAGYRIPAEYEPVSTVVMTWAGHSQVLADISVAAAAAGVDVWMVGGPDSIPGVPTDRYTTLVLPFESIWSRDYGPVGIDEATNELGIVDTTYRHYATRVDDDAMSCRLATELEGDCHSTSLVLDGGNFMTDGKGNAFLTSRVYDWNSSMSRERVDELLRTFLGAEQLHIFDYAKTSSGQPADGTGHIDMFAKLVGECDVVVAQTADAPFKAVTDEAAAYFDELTCGSGTYDVTRVQGWLEGAVWHTYTNSLIVNETIIIPFYDGFFENEIAVRAYERAAPGHRIVGVNSESTIVMGGSIHCVTREIPTIVAAP